MGQMNDSQVTILYGFVAAVLSLALFAMSLVENKQIKGMEAEMPGVRRDLKHLQDRLDARPQLEKQIKDHGRALDELRGMAPHVRNASGVALTQLASFRKLVGLSALRYTRDRTDHEEGFWPELHEAPVPALHPQFTPVTWYVTFDATYWQLKGLLNRIERWDSLALVSELVIRRAEKTEPGKITLRVGMALTVYGHGGTGPPPPLTAEQRQQLLGEPYTLQLKGDDGWYAKGVDWRKAGAELPARNPFDPYAGLTRAK